MVRRKSPVQPQDIQPDLHCSIEDQRRLLGESPFFNRLSEDEITQVQGVFRQQHYDEGALIQRAGDPPTRISIVAAGTVKMARPTPDGQDVLLDFLGPGEHFGSLAALGDAEYREDVTAQTSCCILYTTAEMFDQLLQQYPAVAVSALGIVAGRLRQAQTAIEQLSAYPVDHRVGALLLHLAEKRGKTGDDRVLIEIPISRQDIADMTGAKVETVSRVMSDLKRSGLVESGRRWIAVRDMDALRAHIQDAQATTKAVN